MDEELCQNLEIVRAILHNFVPHIHNQEVVIVVNQLLANLVQLRQELEAFVVDEIGENK